MISFHSGTFVAEIKMIGSSTELLLGLPTALSCEILCNWLCIPSLVRLDSAYCNRKKRPNLLALYQQPELLFSQSCPEDLLPWILERRIKLYKLILWQEVRAELAVAYLKECGLYVTSVQVEKLASAEVIQAVTEYCPNVRVFETHRLSEEIIELLNQRSIERFDFTLSDFVSDILEPKSLRKLVINWLQGRSTAMVYTFVRRCPELTHFSLRFASLLMEIPDPSLFTHFTKLVALNFHSPLIDDGTLSNIADLCPLLEHLDLRGNIRITDNGLYTAATKLKLKTIAINGQKNITDRGLLHLKHCASSLMEVHIAQAAGFRVSGKSKITQSAVNTLLSSIHLTLFDWRCRIMFSECENELSVCACATTVVVSVAATDLLLGSVAKYCP